MCGMRRTFVGARVLEDDNAAFLEEETRLLSQKEVRALYDILEVRFALVVDQRRHVGDVDRLRATGLIISNYILAERKRTKDVPSTTRNQEIGLEPQVGTIPEVRSIRDKLARYNPTHTISVYHPRNHKKGTRRLTRKLNILILNLHKVSLFAQLRQIKARHCLSELRKPDQFLPIDPLRIRQYTTPIDDSYSLIRAQQDFIYPISHHSEFINVLVGEVC